MKKAKLLTGIALALTVGSLVACGGKKTEAAKTSEAGTSAVAQAGGSLNDTASTDLDTLLNLEVDNTEAAMALHQKLMETENDVLIENKALWEKVFLAADKGMAMVEDGSNYGDFLLKTIDNAKDQFSQEELKTLREGAEKIQKIEGKLTILEQKYPECGAKPDNCDVSVPAENGKPVSESSLGSFPAFEGKDLDGNAVKSSELFGGNTVTVVNFWFTSCRPCVEELSALDALNKQLAEKGGAVVGINSFTLDGDEAAIAEAKDVLAKKGASYRNLRFDTNTDAGKFAMGIYSFPTSYVVDQKGNIVGEPIVGAITDKKQAERLNQLIEQALANSKK